VLEMSGQPWRASLYGWPPRKACNSKGPDLLHEFAASLGPALGPELREVRHPIIGFMLEGGALMIDSPHPVDILPWANPRRASAIRASLRAAG
jgi:hypothetical protein